tara:strand:+ start:80703 stop:80945 length:243 start_codon:yes stop_codon:yes gene_type:complete
VKLTEEIIDQAYVHAKSTGKTPDTLRISNDLWRQLKQECEDHKMLVLDDGSTKEDPEKLQFNGMDVTVVNAGEFFRYSIQ